MNRVWHYHFGHGIVPTTSDFGKSGQPPTHPELLDWLASEFIASGWSLKKLHKTIMLSDTYQRSSSSILSTTQPEVAQPNIEIDPANHWQWRQNLRRLEAESIRDTVLAVSDQINPEAGGRGFFPRLASEVLAGGSRPGDGWELSSPEQQQRRSVYTFVKRSMMSPMLDSFDYTSTAQPLTERSTTTVAPQALMLLNDQFMYGQAAKFAAHIAGDANTSVATQVTAAYQRALQRDPSFIELEVTKQFLTRQETHLTAIRSRMTFYPNVPVSLHVDYLKRLSPPDFLGGPKSHSSSSLSRKETMGETG